MRDSHVAHRFRVEPPRNGIDPSQPLRVTLLAVLRHELSADANAENRNGSLAHRFRERLDKPGRAQVACANVEVANARKDNVRGTREFGWLLCDSCPPLPRASAY